MSFLASTNLVAYHQSLLQDRERMGAYRRAVHEVVRPGDVVLDLGAGSGALSLFACQAGARRVYAIESGDAIELAREMSRRHGLQDRIVLVNERSYRARIDEPVDVIVTEYGAAELQGKTVHQRGQALAAIAHPDFRDELMEAADRTSGGRPPFRIETDER